jgi:general secretion pathway protein F
MPIYEYAALNSTGKSVKDIITADTPRDARELLRRRGLHVTVIDLVKELKKNDKESSVILKALSARQARSELLMVTQQFATLLKAGIPLSEALKALVEQIDNRHLESVFRDLSEKVNSGTSLADAMMDHDNIFSPLYTHMVRTGESSGTLDKVLARVAEFSRKRDRTAKKVQGALAYPVIIGIIGFIIFLVLMLLVMPNITDLFVKQNKELWWLTEFFMTISVMIRDGWVFMLLGGGLTSFFSWRWLYHNDNGKRFRDKLLMKIPITGTLVRKSAVARFTSTFSILLEAGVPAIEGLRIVRDVVGNILIADIVDEVCTKVTEGADIATPIKRSGLFPPTVGYMIAVGEESGQLEEMLQTITSAYEEEVDLETQKMMSIIEPLMIVVMAATIGVVILSIIVPMMELASTVSN